MVTPVRPRPRDGRTPRHRPPVAVRALVGLVAVVTVAGIVALMLSDRAPGLLHAVLGELAERWSERLDAPARIRSNERLPESDVVVHIGLWAAATTLVGWVVWTWRGLATGAIGVFALSVVIELGQGRWTATREVELSDFAANAVGVVAGATVAAAGFLVWSLVATILRRPAKEAG